MWSVTLLCGWTTNQMWHSNVCQPISKWHSLMWDPLYHSTDKLIERTFWNPQLGYLLPFRDQDETFLGDRRSQIFQRFPLVELNKGPVLSNMDSEPYFGDQMIHSNVVPPINLVIISKKSPISCTGWNGPRTSINSSSDNWLNLFKISSLSQVSNLRIVDTTLD